MFVTEKIGEIPEKYKYYRLCYIDNIPQTVSDYPPEIQKIINDPSFSWKDYDEHPEKYPYFRTVEFNNPDYVSGETELYAYFTPVSLEHQWGNDWDDAPYNYNAGTPYDSHLDETDTYIEHTILRVPFCVPSYDFMLPADFGYGNTPFSVIDINAGAVAWIYAPGNGYKEIKGSICIYAGTGPFEFIDKLNQIRANHPEFESEK